MRFLIGAATLFIVAVGAATAGLFALTGAQAHAPSGAIFTTLGDGTEVNLNLFPSKESVYLDGGPGPGAPIGSAGLDDGTYVFQVTNPNGSTLLSQDPARCRQFVASGGIITGVVDTDCEHKVGLDVDWNAKPVQLMPYANTPNNGGVYKAWVTRIEDFYLGCAAFGKTPAQALAAVDCGNAAGNRHGFIPAHSKTDNFKVRRPSHEGTEIDVRFFYDANNDGHYSWDATEPLINNLKVIWTDTNGVSNIRFSDPNYRGQAHVEQAEIGVHTLELIGGPGCNAGLVHVDNVDQAVGLPQAVYVTVLAKEITHYVDVACIPD